METTMNTPHTPATPSTRQQQVDAMIAAMLAGDESVVPVLQDAIEAGIPGLPKKTVYLVITRAGATRNGKVIPPERVDNAFAIIEIGKSIRLIGLEKKTRLGERTFITGGPDVQQWQPYFEGYDKTFKLGDHAEYDSYNLSYFGPVKAISEKTIQVKRGASNEKNAHLTIERFWSKNRGFDLAQAQRRNHEFMD